MKDLGKIKVRIVVGGCKQRAKLTCQLCRIQEVLRIDTMCKTNI